MRTIGIQTPFGRDLAFVELKGVEGLSTLYEYRLVLTSKNPNLAASDIIGQTIAVTIDTKGGERVLNGLVTDFGYLSEDEDEQSYHLYTCIMRPNMWYLTQRHDSRVFVDKDILEITRTILDEFGFPYEIQCLNSYRKYGHSTQYQETSFNYLSRLFEQEGLYYYFTHTEGNNTLIIVDDNSAHPPIQGRTTIPYHSAVTPGTPDKNYIDIWQQSDRLATKSVNVNDHSYKLSNRKLDHKSSTHELGGITTEHYDFYTGFTTKEEAASYAQVRSQDYNAQSKRINAAGNVLTIAPGQIFTLSRHPHNAANTEHLIIHAEYDLKEAGYASGTQQSHYRIRFTAIPLTYQYRTPRVTPKPQIIGSQAATVTGPAGEEVHTNDYGDIKVQFHWDRYGTKNEKSSDWIRVAQGSAGGSFGSINTPRIGEEVLIDFINGDSDRPIVIGRLYNSANPPPWGYPQAAKQSGIKSKSFNSPLENYNELMFNDDAGFELVNLQAQRDLNSLVKNDETRTVNRDRTTTIDKDETVTVHGQRTEIVDKDEHITIHQNRTEVVDGNETITIHKNRKERVDLDETISIGGNRDETVHKSEKVTIKGNRDKTVNGNDTLNVKKNRKENVHKSRSLNVDKNNTEFVKLAKSVTVGLAYATQVGTVMNTAVGIMQTEQIGRIKKSFVGKSYSITAGDEFKITVGKSSLVMNADGSIIITGSTIVTQAEKENKVIGKDVLINPPGASNSQVEEPSTSVAAPVPSSQATNPNGLPSALAALKQGPLDRAGSFGRVDDTEADGSLIAGNTHSNDPNQGGGGLSGFGNYNPSPYDKPPEGYKYVWDGRVNDMVLKPIPDNKSNFAVDPIAVAFPAHARLAAKDPKVIAQSNLQSDMRNVTYAGAAIAGYGPYVGALAKEGVAAAYGATAALPAGVASSASTGGALGLGSYGLMTDVDDWKLADASINTIGGALTGGSSAFAKTAVQTAVVGGVGTGLTQYAVEGKADIAPMAVNAATGGLLKPFNLGMTGDIAQAAATAVAPELSELKEVKPFNPASDRSDPWESLGYEPFLSPDNKNRKK